MKRVEIELQIKQTPKQVEEILLKQGFTIFQKRRTIANYYTNKKFSTLGLDLKEKSIRIRTSINLLKNSKPKYFSVEHTDADFDKILKTKSNKMQLSNFKTKLLEKNLLKNNFSLILTDDKTDFVYMHPNFETNKIAFQIQNIQGIGTIVAYDNELYEGFTENKQREKLIEDIKSFGIEIENIIQVQRYKNILNNSNKLSIKQIISLLKNKNG